MPSLLRSSSNYLSVIIHAVEQPLMREIQQCHGSEVKQEQTQCVVSTWRSRDKVLEHLGIASTYKITLHSPAKTQ
jgi:hypothetical protein